MNKEDFVDFELAKKLKDKGYPQITFGEYNMGGSTYFEDGRFYENGCICHKDEAYTAPTISQVLKWLREKKNIEVVASFSYRNKVWGYQVGDMTLLEDSILSYDYSFSTYEEAALAGVNYCLENLI